MISYNWLKYFVIKIIIITYMDDYVMINNQKIFKRKMFAREGSDTPLNGITSNIEFSFGCY